MVDYWQHFKGVQLNTSIDATGARDRYIRYLVIGQRWKKTLIN